MKRLLLLLALLCIPAAADSPAGYLWRIYPDVNSKWTGKYTQKTRLTQQVPAPGAARSARGGKMKIEMTMNQEAEFDWDVLAKDKAGMLKIRLMYNEFNTSANVKTNGAPVSPEIAQALTNRLDSLNRILRGATFTFTLSPTGKVSGLQGAADIAAAFRKEDERKSPSFAGTASADFKNFYTVDGLETLMSSNGKLPAQALQIGQTHIYQQTQSADSSEAYIANMKHILTKREANLATFTESGTARFKMPPASAIRVKFDGSGDTTGTLQVIESSGVISRYAGQFKMRGNYVATTPDKKKITVPSSILLDVVITMQPRKDNPGVIVLG